MIETIITFAVFAVGAACFIRLMDGSLIGLLGVALLLGLWLYYGIRYGMW